VLQNYRRIPVRQDHALVIPLACRPGEWFGAGTAVLAPLHRKRIILIERPNWVHVWTLYNEKLSTRDWLTPPEANTSLHFSIEIRSRAPSGWVVTIPPHLRNTGWLPSGGGNVMFEYCASEANFWTEDAYNEESILEADSN
jgi:hypothetical protein